MAFDLDGVIASAGFASGDRFVCGLWRRTPIGVLHDVMWAPPTGERVLLVPSEEAGAFISAVYGFDRVEVVAFAVEADGPVRVSLSAGPVRLQLDGGRRRPIPGPRPAWVTRWLEGPIARAVLGVETYGVSPTGVREWYRAGAYRPVVAGRAWVGGRDLGPLRPVEPRCGFGFSEPPRRPSIVSVRPRLVDPSGRLDALLIASRRS